MSTRESLSITRGDDKTWQITVETNGQPVDLTGATVVSTIRKEYTSKVIGSPVITISSPTNGRLSMTIGNELSALLTVQSGKRSASYVFDVVLTLDNKETTYINGYIISNERVSPVGA